MTEEVNHPTRTFLKDKNGREILFGDHVLDHNVSKNTREEYWNGIYEVCWQAPSFYLKHIGGGLSRDMSFTFKHYPQHLEVIEQVKVSDRTMEDRIKMLEDEILVLKKENEIVRKSSAYEVLEHEMRQIAEWPFAAIPDCDFKKGWNSFVEHIR